MSPRSSAQFAQMRTDRKQAILDAALEVFASEGYHVASISKIAKSAGVSKGLMYNYFESKQDLLHVLLDKINAGMMEILELPASQIIDDAFFEGFIRKTFILLESDNKLWRLYYMLFMQPDVMRIEESKILPLLPPYLVAMKNFFEEKGFEDPEATMTFFFSQMDGLKLSCVFNAAAFQSEKMIQMLLKQYIKS